MAEPERLVLEAIKSAQAEGLDAYEIRAWAEWGTPQQRYIASIPARLAPTLDPAVMAERFASLARAEIKKLGYAEQEARGMHLTFEPVPTRT